MGVLGRAVVDGRESPPPAPCFARRKGNAPILIRHPEFKRLPIPSATKRAGQPFQPNRKESRAVAEEGVRRDL